MEYGNCKYFEPVGDGSCGLCHRFPPGSDGKDTKTIDELPFIRKGCWCGEHKNKGKKK